MAAVKLPSRRPRKDRERGDETVKEESTTKRRRKTAASTAKRKAKAAAEGSAETKSPKRKSAAKGKKTKRRKKGTSSGATSAGLRFGLASVLRLSDRFAAGLVASYDRAFGLDDVDKADIHLQVGIDCVNDGRYGEAVEVLRKALDHGPDRGPAWYYLGVALLEQQARRLLSE